MSTQIKPRRKTKVNRPLLILVVIVGIFATALSLVRLTIVI